jgi:hypothetical protein
MTLQNEKFEELIAQQLARELDPQRGKAAAAFQAQVAAEAAERAAEEQARCIAGGSKNRESWARREVSRRGLWFWMGVPSLIAACLAVVVTLPYAGPITMPPTDAGTMIVKDAPVAPGVLNEGGTGDKQYSGTLVGGMEIVPLKPAGGVLQDNQNAPQR